MRTIDYEDETLSYTIKDREGDEQKYNELTDALVKQVACMTTSKTMVMPLAEIDGDCGAQFILEFSRAEKS